MTVGDAGRIINPLSARGQEAVCVVNALGTEWTGRMRTAPDSAVRGPTRAWVLFFSSRRRHTRFDCDWSSDVCSSDLPGCVPVVGRWDGGATSTIGIIDPGISTWFLRN